MLSAHADEAARMNGIHFELPELQRNVVPHAGMM
jgi:hypothetical protein